MGATRTPVHQTREKNIYALYVVGDSMEPRYDEGDLVFVHMDRPPTIGCDVVVQVKDGEDEPITAYIKTLKRRTAKTLYLEQYNPKDVMEVPLSTVKSVHKILTTNEIYGG